MPVVNPIEESINFITECLVFNQKIANRINTKAQVIKLRVMIPRHRLFIYYIALIESFNEISHYILEVMGSSTVTNINPLRSNLRTLFEIYSRALYLSANDEQEKLKRIIGDAIWVFRDDSAALKQLALDRRLASRNMIVLPTAKEMNKNKDTRRNFMFDFTFEKKGFVETINQFHDESLRPFIHKVDLAKIYRDLCNQLHGNIFHNVPTSGINPKYQFISLLMFSEIHFLRTMHILAGEDTKEFDDFIASTMASGLFDRLGHLWGVARQSNP